MTTSPALPYGGTSGHAGTPTSRARAWRRDQPGGRTETQQDYTLHLLALRQHDGLTVKELREDPRFADHHGSASGVLSTLHKSGRIALLTEKRKGCLVYVDPAFIHGRMTRAQRRRSKRTDGCTCLCTCAPLTVVEDLSA